MRYSIRTKSGCPIFGSTFSQPSPTSPLISPLSHNSDLQLQSQRPRPRVLYVRYFCMHSLHTKACHQLCLYFTKPRCRFPRSHILVATSMALLAFVHPPPTPRCFRIFFQKASKVAADGKGSGNTRRLTRRRTCSFLLAPF